MTAPNVLPVAVTPDATTTAIVTAVSDASAWEGLGATIGIGVGGAVAGALVAWLVTWIRMRRLVGEGVVDASATVAALPWMKNLLAVVFAALTVVLLVISAEGLFKIDLPEVAWGIVGGVITKLFDLVMEMVGMYKAILDAKLREEARAADSG